MKTWFNFPYKGTCQHPKSPGAWAVEVQGLTLRYPECAHSVLKDLSFQVIEGSRVALVGPNGAGKSTLLRALAALFPAESGRVRIFGRQPGSCHHRVVYLPQRGEVDWSFPVSVADLVLTGRYVHLGWFRRVRPSDWQKVVQVLRILDLEGLAGVQIGRLSGGQQQRALIARTLVHDAQLFLLDEPLNAVDTYTRQVIHHVLEKLKKEGKTVVMSTHEPSPYVDFFDQVVHL